MMTQAMTLLLPDLFAPWPLQHALWMAYVTRMHRELRFDKTSGTPHARRHATR